MIDLENATLVDFQREVLDRSQEGMAIAYFTAPWCGPCRLLKPRLEELEVEFEDLTVVRIDVESNADLAQGFRIMSVPTLFFYAAGFRVADTTGAKQMKELREIVERY